MDIRAACVADRRSAVARIRQENEDHFGDLARQAVQKLLTPALPHPWMYVYELTQNALDAGARRICWRVDGDGALFQHDGDDGLDESDVRGIASLGASTKGLGAVGFMGIGFKSVFARFREAQVSGFGWRFGFDVNVRTGALGSTVPEWFDTLCPHWDDDAPDPDESYTTAFRLQRPTDPALSVGKDLEYLASVEDPTPLAVLALRGLTEVRVGDKVWELSVDDGIVSIRRSRCLGLWRWKTFVSRYRPDDAAMRQFLGVRQSLQDQIDAEGRRVERSVVGLLPLDEDGLPRPPARGRVYSTLPTQARIPFGFHLQADWLVDIDRQSLRQVEGSPWQEAIVRQVPDIVGQFLAWLAEESDEMRSRGYDALCDPSGDDGPVAESFRILRGDLSGILADQPVIPVHGRSHRRFCTPDQVALLPGPFRDTFASGWRAELLFGRDIMDETLLGERATAFARWLGWGNEIDPDEVEWGETLPHWWDALSKKQQRKALVALWGGVAECSWEDVPVVPTEAGQWMQASGTIWMNEEPPTEKEPGGLAVAASLAEYLPRPDQRLPARLRRYVNQTDNAGTKWLTDQHKKVKLSAVVQRACDYADDPDDLPLVQLMEWALHRGERRQDLVPLVLTEAGARSPAEALLADPFVAGGRSRRQLFPNLPAIAPQYAAIEDRRAVVRFLERLGVSGGGVLEKRERKVPEYARQLVAELIGVEVQQVLAANWRGYSVVNYHFPFTVESVPHQALQDWLSHEHTALEGKGRRTAHSHYYSPQRKSGKAPTAWVHDLQDHPWLLCTDGQRRRPEETLLESHPDFEDAPIAEIDPELASRLEEEGVRFGFKVLKSPILRRLQRRGGSNVPENELADLLREVCTLFEEGGATQEEVLCALDAVRLDGVPLSGRTVKRAGPGSGQRSDLGGWVVVLSDLDPELADAVMSLPLDIPETTTGRQALDFLKDVWNRKPSRVENLRGRLAAAYRYVLDDRDSGLLPAVDWSTVRTETCLYGRREWHRVGPSIAIDDVQSPLIHQFLPKDRIAVASAHLGDTSDQIHRVAYALKVDLVSDDVHVNSGAVLGNPPWVDRLHRLLETLARLEDRRPLSEVKFLDALSLEVFGKDHAIQAYVDDGTLMLVGRPASFAVEATGQLVEHFQLGQRGNEIPWLTGALFALEDADDFLRNLRVLADGLGVEPSPPQPDLHDEPTGDSVTVPNGAEEQEEAPTAEPTEQEHTPTIATETNGLRTPSRSSFTSVRSPSGLAGRAELEGGEGTRRALPVRSPSRAVRAADHFAALLVTRRSELASNGEGADSGGGRRKDDYAARQAVVRYENHRGRRAEEMDDQHPGFDVLSIDDATGHQRRIEVKGVSGLFETDASVVLTARQVHDAVQHNEEGVDYWLYVVDSTETASPRVFPIPWTRHPSHLRYGFYANAWVADAERPATVTAETVSELSLEGLEPLDPGDLAGDLVVDEE